ncbi:MAG: MarR family transcriptional regulator [Bacillota bacterium]|nr:MarR family transcriptional regulator [Bacillota bacterium]
MDQNIDSLTERFDKSLFVLKQNLGPQLFSRAQLGLTPGQVFMLHFIRKESNCSVTKLAEKMEVAPSAITVMLDRLENHGFVSRTRDKVDRRVVLIQLTDVGEEKLNNVLDTRKQIMQHCFTQMEPNELDSFIVSLEKLASIVQSIEIKTIIK